MTLTPKCKCNPSLPVDKVQAHHKIHTLLFSEHLFLRKQSVHFKYWGGFL